MLVIHIGPRKTATTYLQSNFYRNAKELASRGWLYPVVAQRAQNAHHQVVSSRQQVLAGEGALFKRLKKAADDARTRNLNMLLSSEGFRKWRARDFAKLGKLLGQEDVLVAYTLRDPMTLLVSLWGESVKYGRRISLPDFVSRELADRAGSEALDPFAQLQPVLDHPRLRLAVLDFEAIRRDGQDIYTAFGRHVLGLEGLEPSREKPANFSFPVELSDYLRKLSDMVAHEPKNSEVMFSRLFQACHSETEIDTIVAAVKAYGSGARRTVALDRNVDWYRALGAELIARLGPRLHPIPVTGQLFGAGTQELVCYDIDRLAEHPEIARLLEASVNKMKAGRVPWTKTRLMRTWRALQRRLGF